ncbi:type-2 ice-structuring protein [Gadus morhua]|uniref:type-2 ice-structuring protein n=1 Tax=Gadus morhua TaxID=8049 RepID=UPI0011B70324|nr:type-2 ice-structuring protein-like [Gadus morhua]
MRGLLALVLLGGVLAVGAAPGARNSSALTSPAGTRAERINFCLDGWDNFRGDCFYLENNPASWGTAERLCAEREGSLASAHSALEYHYLQRLAQKGGHTFAWLGDTTSWVSGGGRAEVPSTMSIRSPTSPPAKTSVSSSTRKGTRDGPTTAATTSSPTSVR